MAAPICECEYGPILEPPKDDEGKVQSFEPQDTKNWMAFYEKYGFVVIRNIAPEEMIDGLDDEMIRRSGYFYGADLINDPESVDWASVYGSAYNMGKGFFSIASNGPVACKIRQLPHFLKIFSLVLGRSDIYTKMDRFGLMRPTKDHPEWATEVGFVHWDQNPTLEPNYSRVQAIVTLTDHTMTSGGFHCIPGSHKWMKSYGEKMATSLDGPLVKCKGECLRQNHLFRIPARKGSLILWDSRTAHGNWPNQGSSEWRKVWYVTFYPRPDDPKLRKRIEFRSRRLPHETQDILTVEGRQIFAKEEYNDKEIEGEWLVDLEAKYSNLVFL
mmetsp:Transcript_735/g.1074  ORF Transcript_735/g.1074 Transcript_735/m.1074 type:complete len:328 (+) Transcript_735:93-1076(+)